MNTNLITVLPIIFTITDMLTTNVTEEVTKWETKEWVILPKPPGSSQFTLEVHGEWYKSGPIEKLVTTTISKTTRLTYEWPTGVPRTNELSEVVTNYYRLYKLEKTEVWKEHAREGHSTNNLILWTNSSMANMWINSTGTNVLLRP